jgi:hypothetical protein
MTDSKSRYIYNDCHLFPNEGKMFPEAGELPSSIDVDPMTLECINVKPAGNNNFMNADTWYFQIVGHGDRWYHTHYDWALVENTPENVALAWQFHEIHRKRDELQRHASTVFKQIRNLKHFGMEKND